MRRKRQSRERFGAYLIASIDDGGGKVHRWLKGDLLTIMTMIPKKAKGEFRMIAAMCYGWRVD